MGEVKACRCEVWPWNVKEQLSASTVVTAKAYCVQSDYSEIEAAVKAAVVGKGDFSFCDADNSRLRFLSTLGCICLIRISLRAGVTDNSSRVLSMALQAYGVEGLQLQDVRSEHIFLCQSGSDVLEGLKQKGLYNPLIHDVEITSLPHDIAKTQAWFNSENIFSGVAVGESESVDVRHFDLEASLEQWQEWNDANLWAFSQDELRHLIDSAKTECEKLRRERLGLSPMLSDIELEIIAQTWSEHCKHKIFGAQIDYDESENVQRPFGSCRVNGIFKSLIAGSTKKLQQAGNDFMVSVFNDNAGIVRFDPELDVCIKVETHNSPSALDPYGGALTGILGVNRDILGVGLGARPVANTNVFCVMEKNQVPLPEELLPPETILEGVHRGVKDGGNKSGIPTVNGAFCFHPSFVGRPLVYCGTIGVLPPKTPNGLSTSQKRGAPGDAVIVAGGAVGKDGIHGATFSSMAMQNGPSSIVQIGDPFMQKCVTDFLLVARERELYSALTDNGAGGLSSSIGEMAETIGGATLDVARVPLKYAGLAPWEIVVSESQERMSFAVPQSNKQAFLELAKEFNVEAVEIGVFHDKRTFDIVSGKQLLASLDLDFLHQSLPPLKLKAYWDGSRNYSAEGIASLLDDKPLSQIPKDEEALFSELLKALNKAEIRSKRRRDYVAQYDQEVGAATLKKPQEGNHLLGVSDAAILDMETLGGSERFLGISSGVCPERSMQDPYEMAIYAIDEAVRNLVAAGIDPGRIALCDNFCWPDPTPGPKNPDADYKAAQLVRANFGLYDAAMTYKTPFVSGKDSMKNDVHPKQTAFSKISALPTLLITGIGDRDSSQLIGTAFVGEGDEIVLIGNMPYERLYASDLLRSMTGPCTALPNAPFNLQENALLYQNLHRAIDAGLLRSCHDVSDEGVLHCVWECTLDTPFGAQLTPLGATMEQKIAFLSNAPTGCFVASVQSSLLETLSSYLGEGKLNRIGKVSDQSGIRLYGGSSLWKNLRNL